VGWALHPQPYDKVLVFHASNACAHER
jgi:hypothetical protein